VVLYAVGTSYILNESITVVRMPSVALHGDVPAYGHGNETSRSVTGGKFV